MFRRDFLKAALAFLGLGSVAKATPAPAATDISKVAAWVSDQRLLHEKRMAWQLLMTGRYEFLSAAHAFEDAQYGVGHISNN